MSYCPLVERLGFDENFMDVTSMVEGRLAQISETDQISFKGHVYKHSSADVDARDHPRLALGSEVAAELREVIRSKLGLTGCAGIATNKLLAKLVSGAFKPNQQTTLLPENVSDIMGCLSGLRKVPGVGHQTAKRLQALGLVSVEDLQLAPLNDLVREFGASTAQRLKNLSLGVDDSPVTPTGAPQSLSDEDSFKKMSSTKEVLEKIQELLSSLLERMHKDGRQPQTFRLTIRKYSATNKWFSRESRQCPIPNHIGQKISSGCCEDAVLQLVPLAMKLFHKMIDGNATFHLTLINVCFSNLQSRGAAAGGRGSITSFFTHSASQRKKLSSQSQDDSSQTGDSLCADQETSQRTEAVRSSGATFHGRKMKQSSVVGAEDPRPLKVPCDENDPTSRRLPPNVDPEVFRLLPEDIQKELLSPDSLRNAPSSSGTVSKVSHSTENKTSLLFRGAQNVRDVTEAEDKLNPSVNDSVSPSGQSSFPGDHVMEEKSSDCQFPGNVDPKVFSELPADVQKELLAEWRQQRPVLKTPPFRKGGKNSMSKDRKAAGRSSQTNSLFKYFKPS